MKAIRNSKRGELSSLGVLLIIALVLGWYVFFGEGGNEIPDEDPMSEFEQHQQEEESQYFDSDSEVYGDDLDDSFQDDYDNTSYDEDDWFDGSENAPVTYSDISDEDLIGYWTNDEYDDQPTVVQFYMAGGVLKYRMFSVVLGDGSGFGLANGHSIFEYNDGMTEYMENLESLFCYTSDESGIYIIFCCPDADEGVMTEKDYGETWYRWDGFPYQDLVDEHYGY